MKSKDIHASVVTDFFNPRMKKEQIFSQFTANRYCNYKLKFLYPVSPVQIQLCHLQTFLTWQKSIFFHPLFPSAEENSAISCALYWDALEEMHQSSNKTTRLSFLVLPFRRSLGVFGLPCWSSVLSLIAGRWS